MMNTFLNLIAKLTLISVYFHDEPGISNFIFFYNPTRYYTLTKHDTERLDITANIDALIGSNLL